MSTNRETKSSLPLWGLRPHEIPVLILLGAAFYYSDAKFRGSAWPLPLFGAAILAGVAALAARCAEEWRQLPNKLYFFTLAGAWVALFTFLGNSTFGYRDSASIFAWMFDIYTSPLLDEGHGLLMPFVVLALFWWKRRELVARPLALWWPGIFIIAAALLLHLAAYVIQQPRASVIAFFIGLYGLTGLAWGGNWLKASFFPFFLLVFCIPIGELAASLTLPLRLLVSRSVEIVAHLGLAPDLIRDGTQLFDSQRTFAYEVAAACSGIRSLVALLALTTIYGFIAFKAPWKRAVMMLAAMPLAVLGNVVRLCLTVAVAEMFGQDAGKSVETNFGFITFLVAFGCVYLIARWLEKSELPAPAANPADKV